MSNLQDKAIFSPDILKIMGLRRNYHAILSAANIHLSANEIHRLPLHCWSRSTTMPLYNAIETLSAYIVTHDSRHCSVEIWLYKTCPSPTHPVYSLVCRRRGVEKPEIVSYNRHGVLLSNDTFPFTDITWTHTVEENGYWSLESGEIKHRFYKDLRLPGPMIDDGYVNQGMLIHITDPWCAVSEDHNRPAVETIAEHQGQYARTIYNDNGNLLSSITGNVDGSPNHFRRDTYIRYRKPDGWDYPIVDTIMIIGGNKTEVIPVTYGFSQDGLSITKITTPTETLYEKAEA